MKDGDKMFPTKRAENKIQNKTPVPPFYEATAMTEFQPLITSILPMFLHCLHLLAQNAKLFFALV